MSGFASISRKRVGIDGVVEVTGTFAVEAVVNSVTATVGNVVADVGAYSSFGELSTVQSTPVGQGAFVRGYNDFLFLSATNGDGATATVTNGLLALTSGQATTGSSRVRLKRGVRYRPGQGSLTRLTALFGTPQEDALQVVGAGNPESGYYFGYLGTDFGIMRQTGGIREIRTLTVTAGVATSTNVTVTLDGVPVMYSIAGGGTVNQTSYEISKKDYSQVGAGWYAEASDGKIAFICLTTGPRTGTFSATGTGLSATFSQTVIGVNQTTEFTTQSQWNIDTMDGMGPSGFCLNPASGNVYQIGYQYLGFGNAMFGIENSATGRIQNCHNFINANSRTTPVLRDPHSFATWNVENHGNAVATSISGASAACFVEGLVQKNIGITFATTATKASVTTEVPIFTVRNDRFGTGQTNYGEIQMNLISAACTIAGAATRSGIVRIYKNVTLTGPVNFQKVDSVRSLVSVDTAATGFSLSPNGILLFAFPVSNGQTIFFDLQNEGFSADISEKFTVTVSATDSAAFDVAMNWYEDQ